VGGMLTRFTFGPSSFRGRPGISGNAFLRTPGAHARYWRSRAAGCHFVYGSPLS